MIRKFIGIVLFALGVIGLILDYDGIRVAKGGALHAINAGVEIGLIIMGIIALVPALALEIAKDLPLFGKAVTAIRPGGQRAEDPPANPPTP